MRRVAGARRAARRCTRTARSPTIAGTPVGRKLSRPLARRPGIAAEPPRSRACSTHHPAPSWRASNDFPRAEACHETRSRAFPCRRDPSRTHTSLLPAHQRARRARRHRRRFGGRLRSGERVRAEARRQARCPELPIRERHDRRAAGEDAGGWAQLEEALRGLPRAHRGDRPPRAVASRRHRDEPRSAGDRRHARRRAQVGEYSRAVARHSGPREGQHRDRRPDGDQRRIAGVGRGRRAARCLPRRAAAGRGRGALGQDEPERVGELPLDAVVERVERPRRPVPEPLRARSQPVRLELRHRRRDRRQSRGRRRRHRDRRLDRLPCGGQLAGRHQADARARLPIRHRPDRPQPGHGRADGAHRRGRGRAPRRAGRRRSARRGDRRERREGSDRLHELPRPQGPGRCAHRGGAREALRLQPRGRPARGGGDRRAAAARRHDRRPGGHPAARRVRRGRVRGAPLRVQGGSERLPRRSRPGSAGTNARRPHRLQRCAPRPRDALLRPGDLPASAGEGSAHRLRLPRGAGAVPQAVAARRDSTGRSSSTSSTRCSRRPAPRPGPSTW